MVTWCKRLSESHAFQHTIIGLILLASALVGAETYPAFAKQHKHILHVLEWFVIWAFTLEVVIKLVACGGKPWRYFMDPWNVFDFSIVVMCFMPFGGSYAAILRLVRIARVLRLVTALPKLRVIVGALMKSVPAMGYIAMLMGLHFYVYAVLGTTMFKSVDPVHFGSLHMSMLTLFKVVTLENWATIMHLQMNGANGFPLLAPVYFVSFILMGTMLMLNLVIGVVINSMEEVRQEDKAKAHAQAMARENRTAHDEMLVLLDQVDALRKRLQHVTTHIKLEAEQQEQPTNTPQQTHTHPVTPDTNTQKVRDECDPKRYLGSPSRPAPA